MMGRRVMAEPLFYRFRIEDHVPEDHLLRVVDQLLDTAFVRKIMAPFYSTIGRPSIDPELMVRMLLIGYLMVFVPSGGSAPRCTSISPTDGSVGSGLKDLCRTIRLSPRTAMGGSARATCSAVYLNTS